MAQYNHQQVEQKWQQCQGELHQAKQKIQELNHQLYLAQERITAMESSKFWKIRKKWFKFKKKTGLPTNE